MNSSSRNKFLRNQEHLETSGRHSLTKYRRNLTAVSVSLVAQLVKNLPAMQETLVRFLGQEEPLKKEMAAHSSILAWRIPWTEEPGRLQSGSIVGHD